MGRVIVVPDRKNYFTEAWVAAGPHVFEGTVEHHESRRAEGEASHSLHEQGAGYAHVGWLLHHEVTRAGCEVCTVQA